MTTNIDISGLNKVELLRRLHSLAPPALFFTSSGLPILDFDVNEAKSTLSECSYIDHCCGRPIKANLSVDTVDPEMYDKIAGEGTFSKLVAQMRLESGEPS